MHLAESYDHHFMRLQTLVQKPTIEAAVPFVDATLTALIFLLGQEVRPKHPRCCLAYASTTQPGAGLHKHLSEWPKASQARQFG